MNTLSLEALIVHYDPGSAEACHCGSSQRAFVGADLPVPESGRATLHVVNQESDGARAHYHNELTEYYVFLECIEAAGIELNGEVFPVQRYTRVAIPPGVKHRVRGKCVFLVVVMPGHRPSGDDDHFD